MKIRIDYWNKASGLFDLQILLVHVNYTRQEMLFKTILYFCTLICEFFPPRFGHLWMNECSWLLNLLLFFPSGLCFLCLAEEILRLFYNSSFYCTWEEMRKGVEFFLWRLTWDLCAVSLPCLWSSGSGPASPCMWAAPGFPPSLLWSGWVPSADAVKV